MADDSKKFGINRKLIGSGASGGGRAAEGQTLMVEPAVNSSAQKYAEAICTADALSAGLGVTHTHSNAMPHRIGRTLTVASRALRHEAGAAFVEPGFEEIQA